MNNGYPSWFQRTCQFTNSAYADGQAPCDYGFPPAGDCEKLTIPCSDLQSTHCFRPEKKNTQGYCSLCTRNLKDGEDICDPNLVGEAVDCIGNGSPGICGENLCYKQEGTSFRCRPCDSGEFPGPPPFDKCAFQPFTLTITDNSDTKVSSFRELYVNSLYTNLSIAYNNNMNGRNGDPSINPYDIILTPDKIYDKPLDIRNYIHSTKVLVQIIMPSYKKFLAVEYTGKIIDLPDGKPQIVYAGEGGYTYKVTKYTDQKGDVSLRIDPDNSD